MTAGAGFAAAYDAVQGDLGDAIKQGLVFPRLADRLAAAGVGRVLEIGCGNGAFGRYGGRRRGLVIDGVDIDADLIRLGRERDVRLGIERRLSVADFEAAVSEMEVDAYDAVVFPFSLQDMAHPRAALATLAGRLRGSLAVFVDDSHAAMTSGLFSHSVPREIHPIEGFDGATRKSIATWAGAATGTSYCRPDATYVAMFEVAGFHRLSSGHFGRSRPVALAVLQGLFPGFRRFFEASFEVKHVLCDR